MRKKKSAPKTALIRRKRMARRPRNQLVHRFVRSQFYSGAISGSTVVDTFGAYYFRLADLPNSSDFTNLFDQYRIDKVTIRFMPRANSSEAGTNQGMVKLFITLDRDDITTPTSISEMLQNDTCKVSPSTRIVSRTLKPKFAQEVFQSAVSTGYGARSGWLDCSNNLVQHYGVKWGLQQLPSGSQTYDVHIKYHLSFKNVI